MKRLLTLLFFAGITTVVMAQPARPNPYARQGAPVSSRYSPSIGKSYKYTSRERDRDVAKVYRKYSRKIRAVNNRLFASRYKKVNDINRLERERDIEIGKINARFYSRRNVARR